MQTLFIYNVSVLAFFLGKIQSFIRLAHQILILCSVHRVFRHTDRSRHMDLRIECQSEFLRNRLEQDLQLFPGLNLL